MALVASEFSCEDAAPVIKPSGEIGDEVVDAWGEATGESVGDIERFPETDPETFSASRKSM
jgi:hypothetical protein